MLNIYSLTGKKIILTATSFLLSVMAFAQSCLTLTGSVTNVSCGGLSNGSINISVTGGSGNYTYAWMGTGGLYTGEDRTNLIAGSYTVTVRDRSNSTCQATQTFTVTEPAPLNIEFIDKTWHNGYGLSCANSTDGELSVFVNGGTGSYVYSLNNSSFQSSNVFSNLPAGTYYTTVKDGNGCFVTSDPNSALPRSVDYINPPVIIAGPAPLSIEPVTVLPWSSATADSVVIFASQSVNLVAGTIAGGVEPYSYTWSPGGNNSTSITVAPTTTTTYTFTVTDASGCTISRTFKVVVNPISGGGGGSTGGGTGGGGNGGGGGGGNSVTVCHNGRAMSVSLSALPAHVRHGDYIGYCSPYGSKAVVGAEDMDHKETVVAANKIYPNPSTGKFAIRITNVTSKLEIQVVNALGIITEKRVIANAVEETVQQFDLTGKPSGVYFIKVTGASIKSEVYRVLIK